MTIIYFASLRENNLNTPDLLGGNMTQDSKAAFEKTSLGAENKAYNIIAKFDPEYFEKLKGIYVDGTFGREGALPRKTKELIMVGITCALNRPRGVRLHCERALALGASPKEILEAIEVAAIPGGMPGLWLGVETLEDLLKTKGIEFK
jgi:4-carboxymuconolactone decarboxylase